MDNNYNCQYIPNREPMKTPERWRALLRRALFVSIPALRPFNTYYIECQVIQRHDVIAWRHVTLWRHGLTSYDVLCHGREILQNQNHLKFRNSRFSTWWPWPLTYDLDLQTHPRYYQGQCLHQILGPYVKRFSRESVHRHTHRHTDRRDLFHTLEKVYLFHTLEKVLNPRPMKAWSRTSLELFHLKSGWGGVWCARKKMPQGGPRMVPISLWGSRARIYWFSAFPRQVKIEVEK